MNERVSVIVPVRNGACTLGRCLEAIQRSTYPDFEVIVVDDASQDDSARIADGFPCRLVRLCSKGGPARSRNAGAAASTGSILFFTDADVALVPDAIERAVKRLRGNREWAAVMGSYTTETPQRNFVSRYKNYLHHYTHQRSVGEVGSFFTGCGAIRRSVFESCGGFNESIRTTALEDVELGYRLWRDGRRVFLDGEVQGVHLKRYSFRSLVLSDLLGRAAPYIRIMLEHRVFRPELSTCGRHALSLLLVWALPFAGVLAWRELGLAIAGLTLVGLLILILFLNRPFLAFLWRKAGPAFSVGGALMLGIGYVYSAIGAAIGAFSFFFSRLRGRRMDRQRSRRESRLRAEEATRSL